MLNFLSTLAKGLFNTKIALKEIKIQITLLISISAVTFICWLILLYNSYSIIEQNTVRVALEAEFYNWLGLKNKALDTSHTLIDLGLQKSSVIAELIELLGLLVNWETPLIIGLLSWLALSILLFKFGKTNNEERIEEGTVLLSAEEYQRKLKNKKSDIEVGNVNIPKDSEVQHTLLAGSPGSGKSQLIHQIIRQIIAKDDLAIIIDPKAEFVEYHYREGIDDLICNFDKRTKCWSPKLDLTDEVAFETFAAAIIEESKPDSYWSDSARAMLVEALKIAQHKQISFKEMVHILTNSDLETLSKWFEGSEIISDFASEKTISNTLRQLKNKIRHFKHLPESSEPFSLNQWLSNHLSEGKGGCLFLPIPENHKESIMPVASAILELLASQILSLKSDKNRRIWIIVDELPSLPQMTMLERLLAQGRSNGVSAVMAIQNYSQMKNKYGVHGADSFLGQCSNTVCLRTSDNSTADFFSKRFGNQVKKEVRKGKSHTKNNKHKSSTENENEHTSDKSTVSSTKLLFLNDLEAIAVFRGVPNPVEIKVEIQNLKHKNEPFIPWHHREEDINHNDPVQKIKKAREI